MAKRLLSCDWGNSSFRLRLIDLEKPVRVIEVVETDHGVGQLAGSEPEVWETCFEEQAAGLEKKHGLRNVSAIVSGMASSNIGWKELPYGTLPCPTEEPVLVEREWTLRSGRRLRLISGLATPDDVMRGEECECLGLLASPRFQSLAGNCRIVLPGTHSKHIDVTDHQITGFRTHLTGELAAVLGRESVLRHSVIPMNELAFKDLEPDAFDQGWASAEETPWTHNLFSIRARQVLSGRTRNQGSSYLLGLLIAHECRDLAFRDVGSGPVVLGGGSLRPWYQRGLEKLSLDQLLVADDDENAMATVRAHTLLFQKS